MSMTKKDYELIANVLSEQAFQAVTYTVTAARKNKVNTVKTTILALANALAAENPRFNRDRFLEACRWESLTNSEELDRFQH